MARVPYADPEDMPEEYRYLLTETDIGDAHIIRSFANNPPVLQSYMRWGTTLWEESGVSSRQVEVVILAVAAALGAAYEWHQHVPTGFDVGLTEAEILALGGGEFDALAPEDGALAAYAVAVVRDSVDGAHFDDVAEYFDDETIVGVTLLAGHYLMTARALSALDVETEDGFIGWELEHR